MQFHFTLNRVQVTILMLLQEIQFEDCMQLIQAHVRASQRRQYFVNLTAERLLLRYRKILAADVYD